MKAKSERHRPTGRFRSAEAGHDPAPRHLDFSAHIRHNPRRGRARPLHTGVESYGG